jgi:hypothetical protein
LESPDSGSRVTGTVLREWTDASRGLPKEEETSKEESK